MNTKKFLIPVYVTGIAASIILICLSVDELKEIGMQVLIPYTGSIISIIMFTILLIQAVLNKKRGIEISGIDFSAMKKREKIFRSIPLVVVMFTIPLVFLFSSRNSLRFDRWSFIKLIICMLVLIIGLFMLFKIWRSKKKATNKTGDGTMSPVVNSKQAIVPSP